MPEDHHPSAWQPIAVPHRRIADMDLPTFFILLFVTMTLAVTAGVFLFYYVLLRAIGVNA